MYNTSIKNEWKQELSSTSSHLFFCIQSATLSQSRPENCPQPLLLEISGPGSPLLSAQQICLIHQQHVHLVVWHLLHVWLLAAHVKLLIKRKLNVSTYRLYQLLLKVLLCQCVKQIAGPSKMANAIIWIIFNKSSTISATTDLCFITEV